MPPLASLASEVTFPPGWGDLHPKEPSATPSIGELVPFLGFVLALFAIGLVLNFVIRLGVLGFSR